MPLLPEIHDVLPQSPRSLLRLYCEYASACGDAPQLFHLGVGLTVLAAAVGKKTPCPWLAGRMLLPNLYTLLIGPSRSARKTAAMDIGIDLLQTADPTLIMPIPGSYEELIAQIRTKPDGLLTYREFGHFLKTTQRGYGEPIRTVLMDLFDWPTDRPYTRNLKKGQTIIQSPICLSMLGGVSTELLFAYSDLEEWVGGFFGRMLLLYAGRTEHRMPQTWFAARQHLATEFVYPITQWQGVPCGGFSPAAWEAFGQWAKWRDDKTHELPPRVQTFIGGLTTLAAKIAILFAVDAGEPHAGMGWLVSYESLRLAIRFVETLYLPSVQSLGERIALGIWERDRQRVFDVVVSFPLGVSRRELLRRVRLPSDQLDTILSTLKEEGAITQGQASGGGINYRLANPNAPETPQGRVLQFKREESEDDEEAPVGS